MYRKKAAEKPPATRPNTLESVISQLRAWRNDATNKQLYETAIWWADKVLSMSLDPQDGYQLAHLYFITQQYARAEQLLASNSFLLEKNAQCRCLAAQCADRLEKWQTVLDLLENDTLEPEPSDGLSMNSVLSFLRGKAHLKLHNIDQAKVHLKKSLSQDSRNYEAFQLLVSQNLLDETELSHLVTSLPKDHPQQLLIKLLYQTRITSYSHNDKVEKALEQLETDFKLQGNLDLAIIRAEHLYTDQRFEDCLAITKDVLHADGDNLAVLPIHIACLVELERKHDLFYKAHELVERHPTKAVTWYAVGCYYHLIKKYSEARRYFGKSTSLDETFAPAWMGFAHAFAKEGEHDQAVAAYSTAAKLFQRVHLPTMYIGMQNVQLGNLVLAEDYLLSALNLCDTDPLLLNELGVVCYQTKRFAEAVTYLERARELTGKLESRTKLLESILSNLANAHRRLRHHEEATKLYKQVLSMNSKNIVALTGLGVILHLEGKLDDAVVKYHQALGIKSDDFATEMLSKCLTEMAKRQNRDKELDNDKWIPPVLQERLVNVASPILKSPEEGRLTGPNSLSDLAKRSPRVFSESESMEVE